MPSCEEFNAQISCLIDGELTDEEARRLEAHIATCESCKMVYDSFRFIASALSDELAEPPETLAASVMEKIREVPRIEKKRSPKILFLRYGAVAACLALVLLGASRLNFFGLESAAPQSPAAASGADQFRIMNEYDNERATEAVPAPTVMAPSAIAPDPNVTTAGVGEDNDEGALEKSGEIFGFAPENVPMAETLSVSRADAFLAELAVKNAAGEAGLPESEPEIILTGETTQGESFTVYVYNAEAEPLTIVRLNGENILFTGDIEPYLTPES